MSNVAPDLFGTALARPARKRRERRPVAAASREAARATTLEERFQKYDRANPAIWSMFKKFAFEALCAGRERLSAKLIIERIRWETTVSAVGDPFKINNSFGSYYARKFEAEYRNHAGKFEKRALRA